MFISIALIDRFISSLSFVNNRAHSYGNNCDIANPEVVIMVAAIMSI